MKMAPAHNYIHWGVFITMKIFRLYNEHSSRVVKFVPLSRQQVIHTVDNNSHELLHDNAAMDVKYISSFGFSIGKKRQWKEIPLTSNLFQKVRRDRCLSLARCRCERARGAAWEGSGRGVEAPIDRNPPPGCRPPFGRGVGLTLLRPLKRRRCGIRTRRL